MPPLGSLTGTFTGKRIVGSINIFSRDSFSFPQSEFLKSNLLRLNENPAEDIKGLLLKVMNLS